VARKKDNGTKSEDDLQKLIYNYNIYQNQWGNHLQQRPLWCVFGTTNKEDIKLLIYGTE
jgi:hypothetical protein